MESTWVELPEAHFPGTTSCPASAEKKDEPKGRAFLPSLPRRLTLHPQAWTREEILAAQLIQVRVFFQGQPVWATSP